MLSENTFTHDGILYDLTKVRILTRGKPSFILPLKDLEWILKYDKPREDRVLAAKHRYPLLVTKWRGKWTVIDGIHRLERYRRKGIGVVPVKEVSMEILKLALITR